MTGNNEIYKSEWGGCIRCITSDGRNVNVAEELNRIEREKDDNDTPKDKESSEFA